MINYNFISDAIKHYQERGYTYLEVPWIVEEKANRVTAPEGARLLESFLGVMVASAEQSFIQMMLNNTLLPGRYVACTPCFRDEPVDELHRNYFIKVELIHYGALDPTVHNHIKVNELSNMVLDAANFYKNHINIKPKFLVDGSVDIVSRKYGIELGSYGHRTYEGHDWIYGTGCAEPRLTMAIANEFGT